MHDQSMPIKSSFKDSNDDPANRSSSDTMPNTLETQQPRQEAHKRENPTALASSPMMQPLSSLSIPSMIYQSNDAPKDSMQAIDLKQDLHQQFHESNEATHRTSLSSLDRCSGHRDIQAAKVQLASLIQRLQRENQHELVALLEKFTASDKVYVLRRYISR